MQKSNLFIRTTNSRPKAPKVSKQTSKDRETKQQLDFQPINNYQPMLASKPDKSDKKSTKSTSKPSNSEYLK